MNNLARIHGSRQVVSNGLYSGQAGPLSLNWRSLRAPIYTVTKLNVKIKPVARKPNKAPVASRPELDRMLTASLILFLNPKGYGRGAICLSNLSPL